MYDLFIDYLNNFYLVDGLTWANLPKSQWVSNQYFAFMFYVID